MDTYARRISQHQQRSLISSTPTSLRYQIDLAPASQWQKYYPKTWIPNHVSARRVHSPLIFNPPLDSIMPLSTIENNLLLLTNQAVPMPISNGYANIYSSDSEDDPVFNEMVSNDKTVNSINIYYVVPLNKN